MSRNILDIVLPDWAEIDTVVRSPLPFGLWTVGDQCILHHWLDHAVNEGAEMVRVHAADRPAAVRKVLEDSLLWPLKIEFRSIAYTSQAPADAVHADWLPGCTPPPDPADGWDLVYRAAAMEAAWLDRLTESPEHELLSIGFSCRIHPDAELTPPFFIGDHVFIGPGCKVGPYAVIGQGSVLSGANVVSHSHLAAHSFVGPVTALENCRLESGVVHNLKHRATLDQLEPHLVSTLGKVSPNVPIGDRIRAFLLHLRLGGPRTNGETFRTFDGRELPGNPDEGLSNRAAWLPLVWQGRLPLFGVLPRTEEQFEALNPDWKNAIRHAPIGVFSYADSQGCHHPSDPEEALHAVYQTSLPPQTVAAAVTRFVKDLKSSDLAPTHTHS